MELAKARTRTVLAQRLDDSRHEGHRHYQHDAHGRELPDQCGRCRAWAQAERRRASETFLITGSASISP